MNPETVPHTEELALLQQLHAQVQTLGEQLAILQETVTTTPKEIRLVDANRIYDEAGKSNLIESTAVMKCTFAIDTPDPRKHHYVSFELSERRARDVGTPEAEHSAFQHRKLKENFERLCETLLPEFKSQLQKL